MCPKQFTFYDESKIIVGLRNSHCTTREGPYMFVNIKYFYGILCFRSSIGIK